jgi:hypothetical protein
MNILGTWTWCGILYGMLVKLYSKTYYGKVLVFHMLIKYYVLTNKQYS